MPEDMSDRMPEDMPDRMPEDMSDRMPDRMPEDMSDRMPEDMPDRMPEDMSVRKCINVMVGITRSKVIFSICTLLALWTGFDQKKNLIEALEETQATLKTEREASWISSLCRFPFCHFVTGRRCNIFDENWMIRCSQRDYWTALPWGYFRIFSLFVQPWTQLTQSSSLILNSGLSDLHKAS